MESILAQLVVEALKHEEAPRTESRLGPFVNAMRCALVELHPAQLAVLLLEVQAAREVRYPPPHPDYYTALLTLMEREPEARLDKGGRFSVKDTQRIVDEFKAELEILKWGRD